MNIINQCREWQAIPKMLINDEALSYAAKGLYACIASMPAEAEITAKAVQSDLNKRTIAKLLLELRDAGWLEVKGERGNGQKVYVLRSSKSRAASAKNAPFGGCKKCTLQGAKNAPSGCKKCTLRVQKMHPLNNVYNNNILYNNIIDNIINREREEKIEKNTPSHAPLPSHYHYPFDSRLTIETKKAMLIEEMSRYVESGAISPDSAKSFLLYWSEPLVGAPNMMRMEGDDIKAWSLENRIRRWTLKDKHNERE